MKVEQIKICDHAKNCADPTCAARLAHHCLATQPYTCFALAAPLEVLCVPVKRGKKAKAK